MCEKVKAEIAAGGRAFFVFPRIDDQGNEDAQTVTSEFEKYREGKVLGADASMEMMHSQIPSAEQNAITSRFKSGETKALFATSLVEASPPPPPPPPLHMAVWRLHQGVLVENHI